MIHVPGSFNSPPTSLAKYLTNIELSFPLIWYMVCMILHNNNYCHTKSKFIVLQLFIENISKFLTSLPPRRLSSKYILPVSRQMYFFLTDILQKAVDIHRVIFLHNYSCTGSPDIVCVNDMDKMGWVVKSPSHMLQLLARWLHKTHRNCTIITHSSTKTWPFCFVMNCKQARLLRNLNIQAQWPCLHDSTALALGGMVPLLLV